MGVGKARGYRLSRSRHGRYLAMLATVQCIVPEEEVTEFVDLSSE